MLLKNDFPIQVRQLYIGVWTCWECNGNGWGRGGLEIHHILGRKSASAFNSSCLCGRCHKKVGHTRDEHRRLFQRTFFWLKNIQYKPTEEDWMFLEKNYEEIVGSEIISWLSKK
jgi:hypothetical protein